MLPGLCYVLRLPVRLRVTCYSFSSGSVLRVFRVTGLGCRNTDWGRFYEDMGIELARANYRMLMERTLPPRVGG